MDCRRIASNAPPFEPATLLNSERDGPPMLMF